MSVELTHGAASSGGIARWARRMGLERKLAIFLLVAAVVSSAATYLAMTGAFDIRPEPFTILVLLLINLCVLLLLGTVVAIRLVGLWLERRRGLAGARLHARLVLWFSLMAVTPAILLAVFSATFLSQGMETWFSDRVRTAVGDSLLVARAYLQEHQQTVGGEVLAMGADLRRDGPLMTLNRTRLEEVMRLQIGLRSLSEAIVFDGTQQILGRAGYSVSIEFDPDLPSWALDRARSGEVVILPNDSGDRVRALVQLDPYEDTFLYAGRPVDPKVLHHLDNTEGAARIYERLEGERYDLQITFAAIFFVVALLLLLAAIWIALHFATQIVRPIGNLVLAAERVRGGDLTVRIDEGPENDEISTMSRTFNRMTSQLETQRNALMNANRELDERRQFTELVLSGVSAGVIGLDAHGRVNLPNRSASELLVTDLDSRIGEELDAVAPEMTALLDAARRRPGRTAEGEISLQRQGQARTLLVRIVTELSAQGPTGFVVTFDDVSELLSAQRKAAWADIARRIAHEIKNPLTPIQLSAERLKRKYLKEIKSDPETFAVCTDTIVRQVGDIGRMVDEFSSFARMPAPVMRPENLNALCRQAGFLQQSANPGIRYRLDMPQDPLVVSCDARQISQAVTNLLLNAAESIELRPAPGEGTLPRGEIVLRVAPQDGQVEIVIEDNGRGLPADGRERLTEPYVTTRVKGTGLGLAIVKKIMEDHGGDLLLDDRPGGGAIVRLVLNAAGAEVDARDDGAPEPESKTLAHGA
jgi:two-component system nitrogen regulation sensor histidine kinase NtrY